jgi:hypothetical protein
VENVLFDLTGALSHIAAWLNVTEVTTDITLYLVGIPKIFFEEANGARAPMPVDRQTKKASPDSEAF